MVASCRALWRSGHQVDARARAMKLRRAARQKSNDRVERVVRAELRVGGEARQAAQPSSAFDLGQWTTATCSRRGPSSSSRMDAMCGPYAVGSSPEAASSRIDVAGIASIGPRPSRSRRLRLRFRRSACCGKAERGCGVPEVEQGRVGRVRRDPGRRSTSRQCGGGSSRSVSSVGPGPKTSGRRSPELGAGGRGGARVAEVADGGDARGKAFGRAEPRDGLHVLDVESRLSLDVERKPLRKEEAVAEARIHRVLEVRVCVHESG